MAKVTMEMIKELRERTAAGVVDCKKVLNETDGDIEKAIEELQKKGITKAAKKSGRIAAEGKVGMKVSDDNKAAAVVEVNCETDFVAKGDKFKELYESLVDQVLASKISSVDALMKADYVKDPSISVEQALVNATAATGEKTTLRRIEYVSVDSGVVGCYNHDDGKIGVLVKVEAGSMDEKLVEMAEDVAMHVAAMNPACVTSDELPAADVAKQEEIFSAQVAEEGKPEAIIPKIVSGKMAKWKKESALLDQVFVKDSDTTVAKYVASFGSDVKVVAFTRFEMGEGIEKRSDDLAAEVAAMTK